jgi:hypothetical protein
MLIYVFFFFFFFFFFKKKKIIMGLFCTLDIQEVQATMAKTDQPKWWEKIATNMG